MVVSSVVELDGLVDSRKDDRIQDFLFENSLDMVCIMASNSKGNIQSSERRSSESDQSSTNPNDDFVESVLANCMVLLDQKDIEEEERNE